MRRSRDLRRALEPVFRTCAFVLMPAVLVTATASARAHDGARTYTESILHSFAGSPDAASPEAGLILDEAGNLYGTTTAGGNHQSCPGGFGTGCGTVFELDAKGNERVLYSFAGRPDASSSFAGLLRSERGDIVGTTALGGNVQPCYTAGGDGCGTVFKIDTTGGETLLHQFRGNFGSGKPDGQSPEGSLVSDAAGNLYGTTPFGGRYHSGTVFMLGKGGVETILHSFNGRGDGGRPYSGVIRDAAGNLYGTTYFGGSGSCVGRCGTVFKLTSAGALSTLYAFAGKADGGNPYGGLVRDDAGNLYGTTELYGNIACNHRGGGPGCGGVFKLDQTGHLTVLHTFAGSPDGSEPYTRLVMDKRGSLYGTTSFGGDSACNGGYSCGVVFEVSADGTETVLHAFTGGQTDGEVPYGGLVRDAAGNLYGTTVSGGVGPCSQGCGTVFKLTPMRQ